MLRAIAVVLCSTASVAHARPLPGSWGGGDQQQPPIEIIPPLDELHPVGHASTSLDAGAMATGGSDDDRRAGSSLSASISASIEAAIAVPYHHSSSFARGAATAGVRLGTDGPGLSFEQSAKVRPYAFSLFEIQTGDRLGLDVAPSLSDRPDRWRRRYDRAGFDLDVVFLQALGPEWGVQLCRCENTFDWELQRDGDLSGRRFIQTTDWSPIAFIHHHDGVDDASLSPLAIEARAIGGEHSGAVITLWYPRFRNVPLGPVTVDLAFGHAATGVSRILIDGEVVSMITSEELPDLRVPAGRIRLAATIGSVSASAGVERGMYLAQDARLVVEERATASFSTTAGDTALAASGFAAHSVIWTSPTDATAHYTGGATVRLQRPLRAGWTLVGQAELARTFYAALTGELLPRVDTAVRLDLGLHRDLGSWSLP